MITTVAITMVMKVITILVKKEPLISQILALLAITPDLPPLKKSVLILENQMDKNTENEIETLGPVEGVCRDM